MSYAIDGRQYIALGVNATPTAELIVLGLPEDSTE